MNLDLLEQRLDGYGSSDLPNFFGARHGFFSLADCQKGTILPRYVNDFGNE